MRDGVSMLNKRGRVIYVDKKDVEKNTQLGMRVFPNPKQDYYPQFDEEFIKKGDQPAMPNGSAPVKKLDPIIL